MSEQQAIADWRDSVRVWRVEPFFSAYVVVGDSSLGYCYKSRWQWLAIRKAKRLAAKHGGAVEIRP